MKIRTATTAQSPAALLTDLQNLVSDAELMLNATPGEDGAEHFTSLLARFETARQSLTDLYESAKQSVTTGAKYTDTAIRANPYQSLMIAFGSGLCVGVLLGRRGNKT